MGSSLVRKGHMWRRQGQRVPQELSVTVRTCPRDSSPEPLVPGEEYRVKGLGRDCDEQKDPVLAERAAVTQLLPTPPG